MRRILRIAAVAIATVALLGSFASNQLLSRNDVYSQIGTAFTWASTAQSSWSGDHTLVSCSDFFTYIKSDGSSCTTLYGSNGAHQIMNWAQMQQHAVNTVPSAHTPILANNTFAGASFASWTDDAYTACGSSANFSAVSSPDQEGTDGGSASAHSGASLACTSAVTVGMSQAFNIPGASAPTSQSLSFYYEAPYVVAGDPVNCTQGSGSATITVKVNGTTVATPPITFDSNWHPVSTPIGALVAGSNTIDITATLTEAAGTTGSPSCTTHQFAQQNVYIDAVQLTATY